MTKKTETNVRQHRKLGGLQELLLKACPPDPKSGRVSIPVLAAHLNVSSACVYKWIKNKWLPNDQAMRILKLSDGAVTREEFFVFVLPVE